MSPILVRLGRLILRPRILQFLVSWVRFDRRRRLGRRLLAMGLGGFAVIFMIPLGSIALLPLEGRFHRPPEPSRIDGIIVLSGGLDPTVERVDEAIALARRHPEAQLFFSGAYSDILPGSPTTLGLDAKRLEFESVSRNTYENALETWQRIRPTPGQRWLLITSASHMPRAMGAFRRVGWNVTPWPVADQNGVSWRTWVTPSLSGRLSAFDAATHEWLGLLAYWLMGRTDAILPGPA